MSETYVTGLRGEDAARQHLIQSGYRILAERYRDGKGEIDLVAEDKAVLVFVEVKYRPQGQYGDGLAAVTPAKQKRILSAALRYMVKAGMTERITRFDVIEITKDGLYHLENAFYR